MEGMAEDAGVEAFKVVVSASLNDHPGGPAWQEGKGRQEEADGLKKSGLEGFMIMRVGNRLGKSKLRSRTDVCD